MNVAAWLFDVLVAYSPLTVIQLSPQVVQCSGLPSPSCLLKQGYFIIASINIIWLSLIQFLTDQGLLSTTSWLIVATSKIDIDLKLSIALTRNHEVFCCFSANIEKYCYFDWHFFFFQHVQSKAKPELTGNSFYDVITGKRKTPALDNFRKRCLLPGFYARHLENWLSVYRPEQVIWICSISYWKWFSLFSKKEFYFRSITGFFRINILESSILFFLSFCFLNDNLWECDEGSNY